MITVVIIVGSAILFSGAIVKSILESQLSSANGAEVNIERVEIGYWPFNIVVTAIQFADREQPELNLIEIEQARLEISTYALLKSLFVVNHLHLDKIVFATQRDTPGDVYVDVEEKTDVIENEPESELVSTSLALPDINKLIDKADLKTEAAFTALDKQAVVTKENWYEIENWLDDKEKWKDYEARYKTLEVSIKKGSLKTRIKAIKNLKKLKAEVKAELQQFKAYQKKIKADIQSLDENYKQAKKAPEKDWVKLKSSYSLDADNLANISELLFDADIASYLVLANKYYKKIEPYLEQEKTDIAVKRQQGQMIRFEEFDPEPEFIIKKASFTAVLPSGLFAGKASNISFQQHINNKPASIQLKAKQNKNSKSENISMQLDLRNKKQNVIEFLYEIERREIKQYKIATGETLPLQMDRALLDFELNATVINKKLNASIKGQFSDVALSSQKESSESNMASMITAAMLEVDRFDVNADITGTIKNPKLKIQSDLDNRVSKQLKARFKQVKKDYELKLKKQMKEKYSDKLQKAEKSMSEINKYKQVLNGKQNELAKKLKKYR